MIEAIDPAAASQPPITSAFWVLEILLGVVVPAIFFLAPYFNRRPLFLVLGAILAVIGCDRQPLERDRFRTDCTAVLLARNALHSARSAHTFPSLPEWGVALGVIGYALLMLTLGVLFLPLFSEKEEHA